MLDRITITMVESFYGCVGSLFNWRSIMVDIVTATLSGFACRIVLVRGKSGKYKWEAFADMPGIGDNVHLTASRVYASKNREAAISTASAHSIVRLAVISKDGGFPEYC